MSTHRSLTSRGGPALTSRMILPPVAAAENSSNFHMQTAASGSLQDVPASAVNPWFSADLWCPTRKPVRGNTSIACESLSISTRDRDLESLSVFHVCLEQRVELAVRGDCVTQRRLSEADADMEIRSWDGVMRRPSIENSNLEDWRCTKRINELIKLKQRRLI